MVLSKIKDKYRHKAKEAGSLFLLAADDAIQFIQDCVEAGLQLEGIEGFMITEEGAFQPHQEHSNDIADTTLDSKAFVNETIRFISERKDLELWYEIVFSEPID